MCRDIVEEEGQRVVVGASAGHVPSKCHRSLEGRPGAALPRDKRQGGFEMRGCDSSSCLYCQECEENSYCRWGEEWCAAEERGEDGSMGVKLWKGGNLLVGDECREICTLFGCDDDGGLQCSSSSSSSSNHHNNYSYTRRKTRREDIVGGLEFGAGGRLLATAGTSKQVKLYSVDRIYSDDIHAIVNNDDEKGGKGCGPLPVRESDSCVQVHRLPSKLSSIAWNPGCAGQVSVGDYDGNVTSLDVESGHVVSEEDGHCGRRVWSVSYSGLGGGCLASASDDGTVALWDARNMVVVSRMAPNRDAGVPVTGVQFCPWDDNLVAVSATDSKGYVYDVRNMEMPLFVFHGHCRPLSYARFMSRDTVVSAAIDSKIMSWNFKTGEIEATYTGHCNNKHFAGLSVGPKSAIACGSEDTRVYCYQRKRPESPICHTPDRYLVSSCQDHEDVFCSAVAWQAVEDGCIDDCHVLASVFSDGSISMLGYFLHPPVV